MKIRVVVPSGLVSGKAGELSQKYVQNCERYLFQRPDDAIHRGYDGQAESDIALPNAFMSNFLSPQITEKYGLQRSPQLGALNINLSRAEQKLSSTVKGTFREVGETKARPLTFKQVINDSGAIDYFAQFPVKPSQVYVFDIQLKINGETKDIDFSQEIAPIQ